MSRLNRPYGGELVQRVVSRLDRTAAGKTVLSINPLLEMDLMNIAMGAFSPLTAFMSSEDFTAVCRGNGLAANGLTWTIPIVFDISEEERRQVRIGEEIILRSEMTNDLVGFIVPSEVYPHDKNLHIESTFQVGSLDHPGVRLVKGMKPYLLAGEVFAFSEAIDTASLFFPRQVRERLDSMGLSEVAGFHTRNVVHRAHEYLQRVALELTGGLLIQPIVGWKKSGDFRTEVIHHAYARFIDDYYPKGRVLLAFLKTPTRYAGPKEAVFHAIIRKNFGCSHFIVGRDHAGVGSFYGAYDAHRIFDRLPHLGIEVLRLREPFYCRRCEAVASDATCGHGPEDRSYISGTEIRNCLLNGVSPGRQIFRPEILEELRRFSKADLFYD